MFELPELTTIASQMSATVAGKTISEGCLGNTPHKFVWYNREHDEFSELVQGKRLGHAHAEGKWLFVPLEPGYVLLLESGEDESCTTRHRQNRRTSTISTLPWRTVRGSRQRRRCGEASGCSKRAGSESTPTSRTCGSQPSEDEFTSEYFISLAEEARAGGKRSVKGLLTQEGFVPGVGNAIAQDIMFRARLNPKLDLADLTEDQLRALYERNRCNGQ